MAIATELQPEFDAETPTIEPDEHYEVVDGQVVEEPPLGAYEIRMANRLARSIILFDPPGRFGETVIETLFVLKHSPRLRRRPDMAFVSRERWPANRPMGREAAWDVIPDLAVEITSPSDSIDDLMDKVDEYFEAGVLLLWVVFPKQRKIYAYETATSVKILGPADELTGGTVLPGYRFPLADLFGTPGGGPTPVA